MSFQAVLLCQLVSHLTQPICSFRDQEPQAPRSVFAAPFSCSKGDFREEVNAINSCNSKALQKAALSLTKHIQVLHGPSSSQSTTYVFKLSQFSDVLRQKKNVLRVLPYAAFCLTHKPTCNFTITILKSPHFAPPETQLTFVLLFSPRRKSICSGEVPT